MSTPNDVSVTVAVRINGKLSRVTFTRPIEMPSNPARTKGAIRETANETVTAAVLAAAAGLKP